MRTPLCTALAAAALLAVAPAATAQWSAASYVAATARWSAPAAPNAAQWSAGQEVDNQGTGAGAAGNYLAVADGGNGLSTAWFTQPTGCPNSCRTAYWAIRRGASATSWSAPTSDALTQASASSPVVAAADSSGNALGVTTENARMFGASWPAGASSPTAYTQIAADATNPSLNDPAVAFDAHGRGYAVIGQPQSSSLGNEPIWLSTYDVGADRWSAGAPIAAGASSTYNCTGTHHVTVSGAICGMEPRLAVASDGTVVIAFLVQTPGQLPTSPPIYQVWAARRPSGASAFTVPSPVTSGSNTVPATGPSGQATVPPNFDVAIDGSDTATLVDAEASGAVVGSSPTAIFAYRWSASQSAPAPEGQISSNSSSAPPALMPRVVSDAAGDVTLAWTELGSGSSAAVCNLLSAEREVGLRTNPWTAPAFVATSDSGNATGATPGQPPFALAEDAAGNAYLVWTDGGAVSADTRQPQMGWGAANTLTGGSGAVPGDVRLAAGPAGQADAIWVASDGSRNAVFAARFGGALPPPPPPQKGKPAVSILAAGDIHPQQAALHGTVDPEGADTQYYFQYGSTTSYGKTSAITDAGSGTITKPVFAFVRGLTPGRTYHFRLLAKNSQGITVSGDQSFITPYEPCLTPPSSRIDLHKTHLTAQELVVMGQAGERSCAHSNAASRRRNRVVKVLVSIYHPLGHGQCEFVTRGGRLAKPTSCRQRVELQAQGTSEWKLALTVHLPPASGVYIVRSTSIDGFGRRQPPSRKSTDRLTLS